MKVSKVFVSIIALMLCMTVFSASVFAADYSATIVQGNTADVADCKVVFDGLKSVPNSNNYYIWNRGWHYNNGNSYHNYSKWLEGYSSNPEYSLACQQDLIDAGDRDVLYWSGHGGSNTIRLNVHPSGGTDYGPGASSQPAFAIRSALCVSNSNWANTCLWDDDSKIKVAIFGACQILDNTYDDCKYLVRIMKASNVRVIAGYHLTSPTHPYDKYIAEDFFSNSTNGGISGGESIRSSWQTANELNGRSARWAVLCYKDNYNQYYRMPGFPGNTYSAPSSSAPVYRFWCDYSSPTGGQPMTTSNATNSASLPIELTVECVSERTNGAELSVYREMYDDVTKSVDENNLRAYAVDVLDNKYRTGIETVGTITCEEMDPNIGAVPNTAIVVGKTFCYNNQYNGIILENNFYKVATDANGVYFTINNWKDIAAVSKETTKNTAIITEKTAVNSMPLLSRNCVTNTELIYIPTDSTTYRLCYAIHLSDDSVNYIDCVSGDIVDCFVK